MVQILRPEVVRDQEIGPAVAVVVAPGGGEVIAIVSGVESGRVRRVHETAVAVVAKQDPGRSVPRVVVRRRRAGLVLAGPEEIGIDAQIQVDVAVAVVVRRGHRRQHALRRPAELEGVRGTREAALAVVDEEQRRRCGREHQILVTIVVHVRKERRRGVVEHAETGGVGDVVEGRVTAVPVQPIWQAGGLRDVEIIEAVAVRVADRHAVVPVRVTGQHRIDRRHPGVEVDAELTLERLVAAERCIGDFRENRPFRAADDVGERCPADDLPPGCGPLPGQLPLPDVLDTMHRRAAANQVVTDRCPESRRRHVRAIGGERGDQELSDGDIPQVASETLDFSGKGASVERRVGGQSGRALNLQRGLVAGRFVGREQRRAAKLLAKQADQHGRDAGSAASKSFGQLAEACLELRGLPFERKRILPRLQLFQKRPHRVGDGERGRLVAGIGLSRRFPLSGSRRTRRVSERRRCQKENDDAPQRQPSGR